MTDAHTMLGTPLYASPEQLQNSRNVDARTDVWALGVILSAGVQPRQAVRRLDSSNPFARATPSTQ